MKEPTVEIVTATKELIQELRAMDTHNRRKKKAHVDYLRKDIREGRWTLTNQGVGVSVSNFIIDGGHRLEAIELEGYPRVPFILARNLPDEAQKYVDLHSRRSMSDTLALFFDSGVSNKVVACLNVMLKNDKGWQLWRGAKFSPDELIEKLQEVEISIKRAAAVENYKRVCAPVFAGVVHCHHVTGDERVMQFFEQIIRGEMLQAGDPAMTLRNYLENDTSRGGADEQKERFMKTCSAISAFLEGRRLSRLMARQVDFA